LAVSRGRGIGQRRPRRATAGIVVELLYIRTLVPDVPRNVARAFLRVLIRNGVFEETDGHIEVVGKPGLTLEYPADAGINLWRALSDRVRRKTPLWILANLMRGSEASGSGMLSPGRGGMVESPPTPEELTKRRQESLRKQNEELEKLRWREKEIIASLGESARREAATIIRYILKMEETRLLEVAARLGTALPLDGGGAKGRGELATIERIRERCGGADAERVIKAYVLLRKHRKDWIYRRDLGEFGIPDKTVYAYSRGLKKGVEFRGGGSTPLQYRRKMLLDYVRTRWTPLAAARPVRRPTG
jgi:hypothetical protein